MKSYRFFFNLLLLSLILTFIIAVKATLFKSQHYLIYTIYIISGVIFTIIGSIMPELKPNRWVGIRIKWTMEDPDIWNQVHRIAGPLWIIGGYVVALEAFFLPRRWIGPVMLGIIFLLSAFSIIHAWLLARKKQESK